MYVMENELKLAKHEFHQRKNLEYPVKLYLTQKRIIEWYDYWNCQVSISFSGGLDSTVMLDIIRKTIKEFYGEKAAYSIPAVFCNTGLEYPEVVDFARRETGEFVEIRPEISYRSVILKYGYPLVSKETAAKIRKLRHGNLSPRYRNYLLHGDERGKFGKLADKWNFLVDAPFDTSEQCCDHTKKAPFKKYSKSTGRFPYIGISQDEGFKREHLYNKTGCNVYDGETIKSQPIGFWRRQDVLRYCVENDLKIASVYGDIATDDNGYLRTTGEQRTGCIFCAFGAHLDQYPNRFQRLQLQHPKLYEICMKPLSEGGLGMADVLAYSGIPYKI